MYVIGEVLDSSRFIFYISKNGLTYTIVTKPQFILNNPVPDTTRNKTILPGITRTMNLDTGNDFDDEERPP